MADESLQLPNDQNIDFHIVTLFERLEAIRKEPTICFGLGRKSISSKNKFCMQNEIRTVEFWRSIMAECLASFLYVFIVCGAAGGVGVGASVSSVLLATALASGFAVTMLTQCFSHISGAHINPAVTIGLAVIRVISPLRTTLYITAQCGGGIAGAALLYGVTVPGYQGNLQSAVSHSAALASWERFGVEFILTFVVVLAYMISMDSYKRIFGNASIAIGCAYAACSFVSMPYLNPARSLGPSFVLNKWDNHWVYWFGPLVGGAVSGFIYEYIFNPNRNNRKSNSLDNESSSMQSDDDLNYDLDLEKNHQGKYPGSTYRGQNGALNVQSGYCQSMYNANLPKFIEPAEPIYGGTRSMYCKSPPLTRANLNRSQSVYAKSNTAINRDLAFLKPGPLVPAQSQYLLRPSQTQAAHVQNQNVQNQMQQRSENLYGVRGSIRQPNQMQQQQQPMQQQQNDLRVQQHQQDVPKAFQPVYGTRTNPCEQGRDERDDGGKYGRMMNRPESVYGIGSQRHRSVQSDDSSYESNGPTPSLTPPTHSQRAGDLIMTSYAGITPTQSCRIGPPSANNQNLTVDRKIQDSGNPVRMGPPSYSGPKGQSQTQTQHLMPPPPQYNVHPMRQH